MTSIINTIFNGYINLLLSNTFLTLALTVLTVAVALTQVERPKTLMYITILALAGLYIAS